VYHLRLWHRGDPCRWQGFVRARECTSKPTAAHASPPLREGAGAASCRDELQRRGARHGQAHSHADGRRHVHAHDHEHAFPHACARPCARLGSRAGSATTPSRLIQIERDILARNDGYAAENRRRFDEQGIFALNLVSSPGSGKTSLLCRTIEALKGQLSIAVIEGDQQTSRDAERIRATGVAALQINTGKGCHLDAHMVGHALHELAPADDSLLLIENVGNLVCPAAFDLGEACKVVILSVTEGEDKPLKYPNMFHAASLMLLNKVDLLPYLSFDSDLAIAYARQVNPALQVIPCRRRRARAASSGWPG
jgi:hydrogenase nickel incorporation protein HypB